jgi:hypothetical protein
MQGSHSVLSMPAVQNNNFTSLLDRRVARSGLSYDGYVRQHAGHGNCRQIVEASFCLTDFKKLKNTKIA